jgi:chromosome segregation ATPase
VAELRARLEADMAQARARLDAEAADTRARLQGEIAALRQQLDTATEQAGAAQREARRLTEQLAQTQEAALDSEVPAVSLNEPL